MKPQAPFHAFPVPRSTGPDAASCPKTIKLVNRFDVDAILAHLRHHRTQALEIEFRAARFDVSSPDTSPDLDRLPSKSWKQSPTEEAVAKTNLEILMRQSAAGGSRAE
jgi:hypothetical protein